MEIRLKNQKSKSKFDKVVKREICQVSRYLDFKFTCSKKRKSFYLYVFHFFSEGTRIHQSQGGDPKYLTAICGVKDLTENVTTIGVCFVDTSIGVIHLAKFDDDKELSGLETLLALYPPAEILFDKSTNKSLLNSVLAKFSAISKRPLPFPDGKETFKLVHYYYGKFVKDNPFRIVDKSLICFFSMNRHHESRLAFIHPRAC